MSVDDPVAELPPPGFLRTRSFVRFSPWERNVYQAEVWVFDPDRVTPELHRELASYGAVYKLDMSVHLGDEAVLPVEQVRDRVVAGLSGGFRRLMAEWIGRDVKRLVPDPPKDPMVEVADVLATALADQARVNKRSEGQEL